MSEPIRESDLEFEKVYADGQLVNEGARGCLVHHAPSGIDALSTGYRSYLENRAAALTILFGVLGGSVAASETDSIDECVRVALLGRGARTKAETDRLAHDAVVNPRSLSARDVEDLGLAYFRASRATFVDYDPAVMSARRPLR